MPTIDIQLHAQCPSRGIYQHWQHLPIVWTYQTNGNTDSQDWTNPQQINNYWQPMTKRSLLPFFGDALHWVTGTATIKDTMEIKQWVNLLIQEETQQQESLVHIISILNITWYAMEVNRQKLNEIMDTLQKANKDMNTLSNITDILMQHFRYHQIYPYAHTILAYPRDCPTIMWQVATNTMDYVDAMMTKILPPDILPVEELGAMLGTSKCNYPQ